MIDIGRADLQIRDFICRLAGEPPVPVQTSLGQYDSQEIGARLTAGVIYHGLSEHDIHASIAVEPGQQLRRRFVVAMFHYPFVTLGKARITVCVRASNIKSQQLALRLGFKQEGTKRHGYPDGEAMMLFGLLREECKWLRLARRYGLEG